MIDRKKKSTSSSGTGTGITAITSTRYSQFPIDTLAYVKEGVSTPFARIVRNSDIYYGSVNWIANLDYGFSAFGYDILDNFYTSDPTRKTLSAADPLLPRIDIFVLDNSGNVEIIEGTPAENPQKPTCDPETQTEITHVLIPAGATEPTGITSTIVFDEHVAGEFTPSASGVTVDFDQLTERYQGTKAADVGAISKGNTIIFESSSELLIEDYTNLIANLKLKAVADTSYSLTVQFKLNAIASSNEVKLPFNVANSTTWQTINVLTSLFRLYNSSFNQIVLKWNKTGAPTAFTGFYLDFIKLEKGIDPPGPIAMLQPDWNQKNPTKRDYIKNKPDTTINLDLEGMIAGGYEIPELSLVVPYLFVSATIRCTADSAVLNIDLDGTNIEFNNSADIPVTTDLLTKAATANNQAAIGQTLKVTYKSGTATRVFLQIRLRG